MGPMSDDDASALPAAIARIESAGAGLLGIGIPRCPASALLGASLAAVAEEDPGALTAMCALTSAADWELRESHLWPREIRVSRASVPVVARYRDGAWTTRHGAAPADVLAAWLAGREGEAGPLRETERRVLTDTAARRAQHAAAKAAGIRGSAE